MLWFDQSWLVSIVDVSVKSVVLALLAGAALALFRVRNTNVRHRVWTAVLVGMLTLPLLVPITPAVPLPAWLTPKFPKNEAKGEPSAERQLDSMLVDPIELDPRSNAMTGFEPMPLTEFDGNVSNEFTALDEDASESKPLPADEPSAHAELAIVGPTSSLKQPSVVWLLAASPTIVGTVYFSVVCGFVLRILVGLWGTHRIVARSRITEFARGRVRADRFIRIPLRCLCALRFSVLPSVSKTPTLECCSEAATARGSRERNNAEKRRTQRRTASITSAAVYESNELRVPLTVGFFKPKVLLPAEWTQWSDTKLEAVLAHESAHIRRCDYLVALLGEVNRAIYWFHPLAWLLRSWLSELAEQSCDDAVIASTGERTQYARHLLEVAGSLREKRGRIAWSGVAMARKANVETRIEAILDSTRPLARHIGVFGALLLIAAAVPAVLLAAALRPSGPATEPVQAEEATVAVDAETSGEVKDDETPPEKGPKGLPRRISGKVLGPDGKPRKGAIVYAAAIRSKPDASSHAPEVDHLPISETTSDENGDFTLSLGSPDNEEVNRSEIIVVAYAEGFGPDAVRDVQLTENPSPTLRLVRDTPIEGRVLDTEGTPIEGVSLRLRQVITPTSDDAVAEWIENERPEKFTGDDFIRNDLMDTRFPYDWNHVRLAGGARPLPKDVVTGPDGRFRFAGIGSNRLAILEASGPSIAKQMLSVVTRPMYSIRAYPSTWEGTFDAVHYGATFNFVARPSQPIVGTITNLDGQPLVDATVFVSQIAGLTMSQSASFLSAKTDPNGQFAINGAPQGGGHRVTVRPADGEPYFETGLRLPSADGFVPIEIRFALPRGRWIAGTVTDEATGEPIPSTVLYYPFRANKYAENFPNYDPQITGSAPNHGVDTKEDGSFRILAIPGEGVLAARASKQPEVYLSDVSADLLERMGGEQMPKMYNPWSAKWFHSIRPVDIADDTDQLTQNLLLKKGLTRTLDFVDENNQPLSGVRVLGRTFPGLRLEDALEDSNVEIIGLTPGTPRIVVVLHEQKKLGKGLMLQPEQERMTVALAPCAEVVGRLVDEDGEPIEGVEVGVSPESTIDNWGRQLSVTKTDNAGHFSVLLPPGHPCYVAAYTPDGPSFSAKIVPQLGTRFELGDVRDGTRLDEEATAKLAIEKQAALPKSKTVATVDDEWFPLRETAGTQPVSAKAVSTRVRGQVLDPDGRGKAGATVYLVSKHMAEFMQPVKSRVLKQVKTDASGRFDFEVELHERDASIDISPNNSRYEQIIATADGFGPAVSSAIGIRQGEEVTLNLVSDDVPIEGQILNLEGEPVAGATLKVAILNPDQDIDELIARLVERTKEKPNLMAYTFMAEEDFLDSKIDFSINEKLMATKLHHPTGTPPQVTTDQQGRFRLTGIGRDRAVALELSGPNIVTSWVSVITRDIKPIKASVFIGGRTNTTYGSKFTYSAEPSQVIEGVVTDADTGTAIGGALVHSSPYESGYAKDWTDNEGRYRLEGIPKKSRHSLHIQPPRGEPYFGRDIDLTEVADGLEPTKLDLKLKRAKWIVGKLTDKATEEPVQGRVFFLPHIDNPHAADYPSFMKGRLLEPRHTQKGVATMSDGAFRLPAISGRGVLAVYATKPHYCVGVGRDSLTKEWLGFERQEFTNTYDTVHPTWVHLLKIVEVPDDGDDYQVDLTVDPGNTLTLQLQDPAGQPLNGVRVHGRLPRSYEIDKPLTTDRVAIQGIDPMNPRAVFLYHPERNLALFLLADHESSQEIAAKLLKCGTLKGRLLGKDGQPLPNVIIRIQPIGVRPFDARLAIGKTDKDGRFQTNRFVPNARFKLLAAIARDQELRESIQLAPGQTLDLGDITCDAAPPKRFPNAQASAAGFQAVVANEHSADVDDDDLIRVRGTVLSPNGEPVPGANVYAVRWYWSSRVERRPLASVKSDAEGVFEISFRKSQFDEDVRKADQWKQTNFVAVKPGHGFGVLDLSESQNDNVLRLAKDVPLTGEIVDLEGNPIAGAQVRPFRVDRSVVGSLDGFLEAVRGGKFVAEAFRDDLGDMMQVDSIPEFQATETDSQGRFRIDCLGADRVVYLQITGRNISAAELVAVTRDMEPIPRKLHSGERGNPDGQLYGSNIRFVASPTRSVRGTVRDAESGTPLAGATVRGAGFGQTSIETKTDEQGRYTLSGMRKAEGVTLTFVSPPDVPYFNQQATVPETPGLTPIELDVGLHRGVWISGRVTDNSGKGVLSNIHYVPYLDNPHAKSIKRFWQGDGVGLYGRSSMDGTFRIVGLPGHALLGVFAVAPDNFRRGVGTDQLHGVRGTDETPTVYGLIGPDILNETREIWHENDAESVHYTFRLLPEKAETESQTATTIQIE